MATKQTTRFELICDVCQSDTGWDHPTLEEAIEYARKDGDTVEVGPQGEVTVRCRLCELAEIERRSAEQVNTLEELPAMELVYDVRRNGQHKQTVKSKASTFHEYYLPSLGRDEEVLVTVWFDGVEIGKLFLKR